MDTVELFRSLSDGLESMPNSDCAVDLLDLAVQAAEEGQMGRARGLVILASEKIQGVYSRGHRRMVTCLWPEEYLPTPQF